VPDMCERAASTQAGQVPSTIQTTTAMREASTL
jgi:hypothetical protein